ncbi:MAG: LamG-like jellyroll fold domain-containing protein, partial [Verrucomicrobiia bacterium]
MCGQIGNLAGWWKFDEGTGTFTADSSGNGNDGTLTNKPVWVTGMFSNALEFTTGSNQWVWVETSGVVTGSFTVSAWLLPKDSTGDWSVVSTRAGTDSTFDLQLQSGSRISADIGYGPYWIITSAAFTHTFTTGSWYYIAYVVTPTNCMA